MTNLISGTSSRSRSADLVEVLDARADVEGLAAAIVLAQDRLAQDHGIVGQHEGAHGQAIDRRRRDQAHLAHAGERHLQGARDRRRCQGQHVDVGAQLLQALLLRDAEMLLLVDDEQAERFELDALAEQGVGADDDIDVARLDAGLDLRRVLAGDQAGELLDAHGQAGEALAEGAVVLAAEQRRRRDDRDLEAGHDGDEGGAQRHLGLAEADVAADQPVHRPAGGEVVQHLLDGAALVVGLDIGEAGAEFVVDALGRRHRPRPALTCRAAAVLISWPAISRMRCLTRALRVCQPRPPSLSSWTSASSEL